MVGTTRTLRRQNAQLSEQADQLGVLLAREQETVAELRELDRLKSDFAAAASHELRTPLTTIRGYAELLKDRGSADDPGTRDAIDAIVRQTGHLNVSSATSSRRRSSSTAVTRPGRSPRRSPTCWAASVEDSPGPWIVSMSEPRTSPACCSIP